MMDFRSKRNLIIGFALLIAIVISVTIHSYRNFENWGSIHYKPRMKLWEGEHEAQSCSCSKSPDLHLKIPADEGKKPSDLSFLRSLATVIKRASIHARGLKTKDALFLAINKLDKIIRPLGSSFNDLTKRKIVQSKYICPEKYMDPHYGFPLYDVGYVTTNCSYSTSIEKLVSVVLVYDEKWTHSIKTLLTNINAYNKNIQVYIGAHRDVLGRHDLNSTNVHVSHFPSHAPVGLMYNKVVERITTEFILIARDITYFDNDSRLDRLVREIDSLDVSIVGGSIRYANNRWKIGCHQSAFQNFTLVYEEGYDESIRDCVFCDYVDGPFLIRTLTTKQLKLDVDMAPPGLFRDFFLRVRGEVAICPDSMFFVDSPSPSTQIKDWNRFGRKRQLYKLLLSSGDSLMFGCSYDYPCTKLAGYAIHPCCVKELTELNNNIMKVCEEGNILCELQCGTTIGAVKMSKDLPWERDGDIRILHSNFTALGNMEKSFAKRGIHLKFGRSPSKCLSGQKQSKVPGFYHAISKHWRVELYAFCIMDSSLQLSAGLNKTLVLHGSIFVAGPRNPALATRNRYPNFFGHSEHYSVIGIGSSDVYKTHGFQKCKKRGNQDCLDRYYPDGNLQFSKPPIP